MVSYKRILLLSLLVIPISATTSCSDHRKDIREIRTVWKNYTEYNANNFGEESVKLIDSNSLNYYTNILPLIINADSITVERLRLVQKVLVLGVRHIATPEKILGMKDGHDLYIFCVQSVLVGSSKPDDKLSLKILSVTNDVAKVQIVDSNNKPGVEFECLKQNNAWKINVVAMYTKYGNDMWQTLIKQSGKTEREYLYALLEYMTGEKPDNSIWHPVK